MLTGEPWCLTPREIGKLTLVQVQHLFFRRRDKSGNIRRDPDKLGKDADPRAEFIETWRKWGLSRERAAELWIDRQRAEKKAKKEKLKKKPIRKR